MIRFLAKRLAMALGILLAISVLVYFMLDLAMDPLDDLRQSTAPNKQQLIDARIRMLHLNQPWFSRYLSWLTHFVTGDPGVAWRTSQKVGNLLGPAMATSFQLVITATMLSILLGVTIGIVSALRQYTTFDYAITFVSFVLFSLPVFWVAVLLKQFLAIGMNDYLMRPTGVPWVPIVVFSVLAGLFWMFALGGTALRRLLVFAVGLLATFAVLAFVFAGGWLQSPSIGYVGMALVGLAAALGATAILAGIRNRRALFASLTTFAVGMVAYYAIQWLFYFVPGGWLILIGLLIVALALACLIGWLWGGPDRAVSMRVSAVVALVMSAFVFVDKVMQTWVPYNRLSEVHHRPIATIGAQTPGIAVDFWTGQMDRFTHLLLPTVALMLISFATFTRYQRGAMLEVLNQDYIRTARSKGLTERVVIVRHALRNALMPLASVIPPTVVAAVGGAVITETIFGWSGMGKMFNDALQFSEPDPVMAFIMITGALAMFANLAADFLYAVLDPRIRVNA